MIGDDLTPFFSTNEFAVDAVLNGAAVKVIPDRAYDESMGMATREPMVTIATNLPVPQHSMLVIRSGSLHGAWRVVVEEPDGTGVSVLRLERAP